eukprot:COSAG01_NODE_14048_length_1502_cov_1.847470_1_plen_78_part_00
MFWPVKSGGGFNAAPTSSPSSSSSESDDETWRNFPRKNTIEDATGSSAAGRRSGSGSQQQWADYLRLGTHGSEAAKV